MENSNQYRTTASRPMRALIARLPLLPVTDEQLIDYPSARVELLTAIRDDSETVAKVIQLGTSAVGSLLACSSVEIEDGTVGADCVSDLGHMLAEMGDLAASLMSLAAQCRHEVSDWVGPKASSPANSSWIQK